MTQRINAAILLALATSAAWAQSADPTDPKATEQWQPVPKVVTPGNANVEPPSDAIVLFDGHDLARWESSKDHSPARWKVHDGVLTVENEQQAIVRADPNQANKGGGAAEAALTLLELKNKFS